MEKDLLNADMMQVTGMLHYTPKQEVINKEPYYFDIDRVRIKDMLCIMGATLLGCVLCNLAYWMGIL